MEGAWNLKEAKGGTELTGERVRRAINACGIGVFMASVWDFALVYFLKFTPKFHYAKRRFPITSKCRHMYGVLNVDEIKN
jgi:hypothetical protein